MEDNNVLETEDETLQEADDIPTSDSLGTDLPNTEDNTENILPEIKIESNNDFSSLETLISESNNIAAQQLNRLDTITSFFNLIIVGLVISIIYKFVWGLISSERF